MGGFLRGWLRDEPLDMCCTYANACGAIVVSRHACSPEAPSWFELCDYLEKGSPHFRLREDQRLNHIHWATNRHRDWPEIRALAFDHRIQLEEIADRQGAERSRIGEFKTLIGRALEETDDGTPGIGALVDGTYGEEVLARLTGTGKWVARPVEVAGSKPLRFEAGDNLALALREWPTEQVVKCLVFYHPDDNERTRNEQIDKLKALQEAALKTRHELMLEVIPGGPPTPPDALPRALGDIYAAGIQPDWWKLPAPADEHGWRAVGAVIDRCDPLCRGVLLLGLDAPMEELAQSFAVARGHKWCKGFAVGRSIFREAAEKWLAGTLDDAAAVELVAENYRRVTALWQMAKAD